MSSNRAIPTVDTCAEKITYQHGPFRVKTTEVWSPWNGVESDVSDIVRCWYPNAHFDQGSYISEYHTIEVDLSVSSETLLAAMSRSTRSQIRRAVEEQLRIYVWQYPSDEVLDSFIKFYDRFAWTKQSNCSLARLRALQEHGLLALSNVASSSGESLVWHCYETAAGRALCWYSASRYRAYETNSERNSLARAHRYLHYREMLAFQSAGFRVCDLGGWYSGKENTKLLAINRFKEGLGGKVIKRCYQDMGITPLGKFWLMLRRARQHVSS